AKPHRVIDGHSRAVLAVVYLPGDTELLSAGVDESLRVWDAASGRSIRQMSNHTRPVLGLALRPKVASGDVPLVASIGVDRTLRLWQPTVGRLVRFARLPSEPRAICWTIDGQSILTASVDGRLRVINPESAEVRHDLPAFAGVAHSLAASPAGSVLVGGQD